MLWQILRAKIMKGVILAKHDTITIIITNAKKLFWVLGKFFANQALSTKSIHSVFHSDFVFINFVFLPL